MSEMRLPEIQLSRKRIEQAEDESIQYALKTLYLICGRASEIVGESYGKNVYGISGSDATVAIYEDEATGHNFEALVLTVKTSKQKKKGAIRKVAIPLDKDYEPWAKGVLEYFQSKGNEMVFPFTRQSLWRRAKPLFKDMTYPIDPYTIKTKDGIIKTGGGHSKPCALHWLRHLRATELVSAPGYPKRFRFDVFELAYFGGWTIKGLMGMGMSGGAFQRYVNLPWESYFPKLLRKHLGQTPDPAAHPLAVV